MATIDKQRRIAETANFFNILFGKIPDEHFSYLMQFSDGVRTYSFKIAAPSQRIAMAQKAIELSDNGVDIWHAVNPVSIEPTSGKRGDKLAVSYQTAIIVDIDIRSAAHKGDPSLLATDFDEAKSFLPFTPSLIIFSGYGLHAYYIFDSPIKITDQNRDEIKRRNNLLLEVIRLRANGKKIDGVGDLPRVLRTPGTFNYKLGKDNAPLCHIVEEDSGLRFSPDQIDERLNAMIIAAPTTELQSKPARKTDIDYFDDNPDFKEFRIRRMLDFITVVDGEYEKWLGVGIALFNEGMDCSLWENWSRTQPDFKEGECEHKWNGFHHDPNGISIASLYQWATENGYVETDIRNEFFQLHPELAAKNQSPVSSIDSLKIELRSIKKALADFDSEKNDAIERLKNVDTFDSDSIFSEDVLNAAAFAKLFDKKVFSDFKSEITLFNRKTKEKKASVNEWNAVVRDKAADINSRQNDLLTRHNEIQAQIRSLSFVATNNDLQNFSIPAGYSVSNNGIEKV
ncbi:MAG: PriCT-2 domain-containing protein, partial [Selenomonadaceae bacterium]|nr:PriCT-2 domain-containing protein [Selenomonadaceae bacterium]